MDRPEETVVTGGSAGSDFTVTPEEWYALYVQVNHEKEVIKRLEGKEISCFLPLIECWSKRLDRRKRIQVPLFPGYVFVYAVLDSSTNLSIVKTPGALSLLRNSEGPLSIPSYQVDNLKTMMNSAQPFSTHAYLREGDWVHVVRGPLAGCIGILNRLDPKRGRLVVSVDIIKKSVAVELDIEDVEFALPPKPLQCG
ncbi:MAG: UpxY family transcription antiterminator [Desulfobacteraceae bacterium]|nr:UpxY family transcription antiterminator [Desulfobacteraceae bacterium]